MKNIFKNENEFLISLEYLFEMSTWNLIKMIIIFYNGPPLKKI